MDSRHKLGVLTTHPIQYQVPWFRRLAARTDVDLTVFFCQIPDAKQQGDGFGVEFQWDIPLLDGYRYEVLWNVAAEPSVTRFNGCDTPEIGRRIREGQFDAVLVNGWVVKSCLQTLWACRQQRMPCIVRGESNAMRPRAWWKRAGHAMLLRQYAAMLYIGESSREFYRRHGVPDRKLFAARYCVDNEWFSTAADGLRKCRASLRAAWQIPENVPTFLFCGKYVEKKRPLDFLKAAIRAIRGGARLHLLMVGDGELRAMCDQLARDAGLPVKQIGFLNQSDIPRAYAAADCLVLPSDYGETWGLVVNEAMASGIPAIVSDRVGCGPDLIREGVTGTVFPFGDVETLAAKLTALSSQPEELCRMGENARRHVADYSFDAVVDGVMAALEYVKTRKRVDRAD